MPRSLAAAEWPSLLAPGMRVYMPGATGESAVLADVLERASESCAGIHFLGVWWPGINRRDFASLHKQARAIAFFIGRELHHSFAAGRIDYLPISYYEAFRYLHDQAKVDLACVQVSPPDDRGRVSLGVAQDFAPAVLPNARLKLAHVNPLMPRTSGMQVPIEAFDYVVEASSPLLVDHPGNDLTWDEIGRHIACLVRDGDTVEVGVGRVQAVYRALRDRRGLKVHAGLIGDGLLSLVQAGAVAAEPGAVTTGVALGSHALYTFVAGNPRIRFASVGETHDISVLRRIDRFVAINSVIEVDLLGQANAEMVAGRQVSGAGGLIDFMRGARLSREGVAVVAVPATSGGGSVSRIVSRLKDASVSVARSDMDMVVTEYGTADLRYKSVDARAEALIAVAAPRFREELAHSWRNLRVRM